GLGRTPRALPTRGQRGEGHRLGLSALVDRIIGGSRPATGQVDPHDGIGRRHLVTGVRRPDHRDGRAPGPLGLDVLRLQLAEALPPAHRACSNALMRPSRITASYSRAETLMALTMACA